MEPAPSPIRDWVDPATRHPHPAVAAWAAHLAAGRIGRPTPVHPSALAADALFREVARDRRRLERLA